MSSMRCVNCNLINFSTAASCRRCGFDLSGQGQAPPDQPAYAWQPPAPDASYGAQEAAGYWQGNAPYQQPYVQAPQFYPQQKLKQGLAITSLVIGCVGIVVCFAGVLGAIPGLICGIIAVKKANQYPLEYGGKGMATAGIVLNGLAVLMIPIVAAIAIPNLLASRQAANEASAIKNLRMLATSEATYQSTLGQGRDFGSWEQLKRAGLNDLDGEIRFGYRFRIVVVNSTSTRPAHYEIYATPATYGPTGSGKRSFYVDETFVLRGGDRGGRDADKSTPALQ